MKKILIVLGCMFAIGLAFGQEINLPAPKDKVGLDLMDAIKARTVSRSFVGGPISLADLSTILWAGNGQRSASDVVSSASKAMRTIPYSGDVAYIDLYVIDAHGTYLYLPQANALKRVSSRDTRAEITPEFIKGSSAMILFAYDDAKVPSFLKGNPVMVREMMNGTAGFAAENIGLTASALKMSTITMYNLKPNTKAILDFGKDEYPIFFMQLGYTE
jgi:hypothetical protein